MLTRHVLLNRAAELSEDERRLLRRAIHSVREYPARETVLQAGTALTHSMLLLEGLMSRQVDDRRGGRQTVAVQVPGDFVDLHGYPLGRLDHDVATLTPVRLAVVPHSALDTILRQQPALARKLWFLTLLDAAMHREWIFRLGRLNAAARVAHFLCETHTRLRTVGLAEAHRFTLPLTQGTLAEICGITSVHVNRVLRELREAGVVHWRNGVVELPDLPRLAALAQFDPQYLHVKAPPWPPTADAAAAPPPSLARAESGAADPVLLGSAPR